MKEHSVERQALVHVHQHCPNRPYLELLVPKDVHSVKYMDFTISSRDQGWCDRNEGPSYTWIDVSARRPLNRADLRIITPFENRRGIPEFHDHTARWDENTPGAKWNWAKGLRPGDIVQLVPRANYPAWVNFLRTARITIGYEPITEIPLLRNTPSMINYIYARALNSAAKEIRVLDLQPGGPEDPVVCSVRFYTLGSEQGGFESLSYCWGDSNDCSELTVYSSDMHGPSETRQISRSVFMALKQLRYKDRARTLWIDQLCISQGDIEERAQQVNMMSEIYSDASVVNIWLGEGDPSTKAGMRIVRDIHNFNVRVCEGGGACYCVGTCHKITPSTIDDLIKGSGNSASFMGMYEIFGAHGKSFSTEVVDSIGGPHSHRLSELMSCLFMNPWFQRIWVLQEALRARRALVYCGPEVITWDELLDVNTWLNITEYRSQETFLPPHPMMPSIWMNLGTRKYEGGSPASWNASRGNNSHLDILDVFLDGLELKATDPRDKLFALLSFGRETCRADELPLAIRPSYSKSPKRVFADFTRWWIRRNKSLAILSNTHGQPGRTWLRLHHISVQPQITRPTWAIGSDGRAVWAQTTLNSLFCFSASKDTMPNQELLDRDVESDPEVLKLVGFKLAKVTEITYPTLEDDPAQMSDSIKVLLDVLDQIIDPCGNHKIWNSKPRKARERPNNPASEVGERLFGDPTGLQDHLQAHWLYTRGPKLAAVRLGSLPSDDGELPRCETDTIPTCLDPFFFVASNGMIGLCPWAARIGDVVAILYGGKVPFLLRPEMGNGDDGDDVSKFEFVGECFVSGAMNGECLEGRDLAKPEIFALV